MSRSIFGWSLPPGCGTLPGEEDEGPCLCCGRDIDNCVCPECPECSEYGDPLCYEKHGLKLSDEQIDGLLKLQEALYLEIVLNEMRYEAEMSLEPEEEWW